MPTMQAVTIHQLAALVAVEREAASDYADAQIARRDAVLISGTRSDSYREACQRDYDAMERYISAKCETDQALAAIVL